MSLSSFKTSYPAKCAALGEIHPEDVAVSEAVGGSFDAAGALEFCLLKQEGLQPDHTVIDVGCGSGRLAFQLRDYLIGAYVGIDVVSDLLDYARRLCGRDDWRFYEAPGTVIPEADQSADFIVFFSVFTHLMHEETFRYLRDSARALKPGGKIVFSFLEFRIPCHWVVFDHSVGDDNPGKVLNQFLDRDMIMGFAQRLGLDVHAIVDGDAPHIPLDRMIRWDDGKEMAGMGNLGQSVCVLRKPYS